MILEDLANPEHRKLTVTNRCELLGICRWTWYEKMRDPLFKARASKVYRDLCGDRISLVLEALGESATILGKEGHPDRKLFLELVGEYQPGAMIEPDKKPGEKMTDDELVAAFSDRPHLLPPGVLRRLGRDPDAHLDVSSN